jgi:hypothetical protein
MVTVKVRDTVELLRVGKFQLAGFVDDDDRLERAPNLFASAKEVRTAEPGERGLGVIRQFMLEDLNPISP